MPSKLLVLCIVLSVSRHAFADLWEFGQNHPTSEVLFNDRGEIGFLEKTKNIQLVVPSCHKIDYVRVDVNNLISNPTVSYNQFTNLVVIKYKPWQYSLSSFDVVMKGSSKPGCRDRYMQSPEIERRFYEVPV